MTRPMSLNLSLTKRHQPGTVGVGLGLGLNVDQEAPVCACSRRWAERVAIRAGGCGQQLRAERCCRAEHAAGGQKAEGRAGAAACRG